MKAYITKYALTSGIQEHPTEKESTDSISVRHDYLYVFFYKPYWYETIEEAKVHAETMRLKKIASLKAQIAKLEKLTF